MLDPIAEVTAAAHRRSIRLHRQQPLQSQYRASELDPPAPLGLVIVAFRCDRRMMAADAPRLMSVALRCGTTRLSRLRITKLIHKTGIVVAACVRHPVRQGTTKALEHVYLAGTCVVCCQTTWTVHCRAGIWVWRIARSLNFTLSCSRGEGPLA